MVEQSKKKNTPEKKPKQVIDFLNAHVVHNPFEIR